MPGTGHSVLGFLFDAKSQPVFVNLLGKSEGLGLLEVTAGMVACKFISWKMKVLRKGLRESNCSHVIHNMSTSAGVVGC